jgi:hypothetical protein
VELGILLNERHKHEQLCFYEEACHTYNFEPIFLTYATLPKRCTWPKLIHNRTYARTKAEHNLLQRLQQNSYVFNGGNRYSKWVVHQWLMQNEYLRPNLPATALATERHLRLWKQKFPRLLIKPTYGSIGRGILALTKTSRGWEWRNGKGGRVQPKIPPRSIIQQRLPLAELDGNPFDIRVSVQRNGLGNWQVTGMTGKQLNPERHAIVTNVAQGGIVFDVRQRLAANWLARLESFAIAIAFQLSLKVPRLADIGLDVGVTADGFPLFIECNFRDLRYSFAEIGMEQEWQMSYVNPVAYAAYMREKFSILS